MWCSEMDASRKVLLGLALLIAALFYFLREPEPASEIASVEEVPAQVTPVPVLLKPKPSPTKSEDPAQKAPTESNEAPPAPDSAAPEVIASTAKPAKLGNQLPDFTPIILDNLNRWMWGYSGARNPRRRMDPKDPEFFDKLLKQAQRGRSRSRFQNRDWTGLYLGIYMPAASIGDEGAGTTQFWMMPQAEQSERGNNLRSQEVIVNLYDGSGPRYDTSAYASPFSTGGSSPYIHLPSRVMTGLMERPERCREVVILPFLAITPDHQVEQFNGAAYCRTTATNFEKLGLVSFYRSRN